MTAKVGVHETFEQLTLLLAFLPSCKGVSCGKCPGKLKEVEVSGDISKHCIVLKIAENYPDLALTKSKSDRDYLPIVDWIAALNEILQRKNSSCIDVENDCSICPLRMKEKVIGWYCLRNIIAELLPQPKV